MSKVIFGDVVRRCNTKEDRHNTNKIYYVGGEHIESNEVLIENRGLIEGSTIGPMFYFGFKEGDVLFVSRNPHLRKAGMVTFDGICSEKTFVLETKDESVLLQRYLAFVMQSDHFWSYMEAHKSGSVNFFINWSTLEKYEFELPDIDKQKSLSDALWAISDSKKAYQNLILKTDKLIESQFIDMFGNPNKAENTVLLTDAFDVRDDLRKPLSDTVRSKMHDNAMYPYYGANGQVDVINQYITDYNAICLAEDCGAYGAGEASSYIISGKAWVNNHAHVLIPKTNCNIIYANELFRLLDITSRINGATRAKLTQEAMKKLPVLLPPIEKQEQFADFVIRCSHSKNELQISLSNLVGLERSILAENFN